MLAELRAAGFRVNAENGILFIDPASHLTEAQRAQVRRHKPEILRELADEARSQRLAITKTRDESCLPDYRAALVLGRLHICCNCSSYRFGAVPAALGHCQRFDVEAWPFVPIWCSGFDASPSAVAPAFLPDPEGARARALELAKSVNCHLRIEAADE
jgi:hypothetical protein